MAVKKSTEHRVSRQKWGKQVIHALGRQQAMLRRYPPRRPTLACQLRTQASYERLPLHAAETVNHDTHGPSRFLKESLQFGGQFVVAGVDGQLGQRVYGDSAITWYVNGCRHRTFSLQAENYDAPPRRYRSDQISPMISGLAMKANKSGLSSHDV